MGHDTMTFQACREDIVMEVQNKQSEVPLKKVSQNSRTRPAKNLRVKNAKSLKRQVASPGNKSTYNQALSPSANTQVESNGNKFPRFDVSSSVRMGNLAQEQGGDNLR